MNPKKIMAAVKQLRDALGMTQTDLALKLGRGMSTIQRWEGVVPPKGHALVQLMELAAKNGQPELVFLFQSVLAGELGKEISFQTPGPETYAPVSAPVEELEILDTIFHLAEKPESPEYKGLQTRWYEMTRELRHEKAKEGRGSLANPRVIRAIRRDIEKGKVEK